MKRFLFFAGTSVLIYAVCLFVAVFSGWLYGLTLEKALSNTALCVASVAMVMASRK
jgi:hypothetical protein